MKRTIENRSRGLAFASLAAMGALSLSGCLSLETSSSEMSADIDNPAVLLASQLEINSSKVKPSSVELLDASGDKTKDATEAATRIVTFTHHEGKKINRMELYYDTTDPDTLPYTQGVYRVELAVDCVGKNQNCDPASQFTVTKDDAAGWAIFNQSTQVFDKSDALAVGNLALNLPANS